jgi:alpha-D-ribose 1-methylphosphonate 5-triphosphate synthase subunit PhnG
MIQSQENATSQKARQKWMAILARAEADALEEYFEEQGLPVHVVMKKPETGTVMIEGRAGGSGRRFNFGEATVTRCVVRVGDTLGFSYALGHDRRKALLAAVADALLQGENATTVMSKLIEPLAERQATARVIASRKAAATKVDFFTLVRGAD